MPIVETYDGTTWVWSEYREKELLQQVPGTRWDNDRRQWHVPTTWASCVQLRGTFGDQLQVAEQLNGWAANEVATRVEPCLALRDAADANLGSWRPPAGLELSPMQRAAVAFLAIARRAALCDGMGSGKTVMTISTLEFLRALGIDPYPALVVAPNSMLRTWARECATWAPERKVNVVKGGLATRRKLLADEADIYVMNWEILRAHTKLAGYGQIRLDDGDKDPKELNERPPRTVVADEAHRMKNPHAKQTRAMWEVMWQATNRLALTGTPIANTPEDAWSIMHGVEPAEWPSKTQFINRYALQSWNAFGGMTVVGVRGEMQDEFFKILDPRFMRRPTQIVVEGLPAKLPPQIREVELLPKQRKAYDQLRKEMLAELDGGILMASSPLQRMGRLMQLSAAYGELSVTEDDDGQHTNLTLAEPSAKLDALDEVLDEIGEQEQAVIFAESKQLINLYAARLMKRKVTGYGLITGDVNELVRDQYVRAFQDGQIRLLLATLGAGGEGLTLTAARHVIFLQRSFSLVKNKQAEDRVWRKGQEREVQPIYIVAANTIDARVLDVGEEKAARLEEIVRDEETIRKWLSK